MYLYTYIHLWMCQWALIRIDTLLYFVCTGGAETRRLCWNEALEEEKSKGGMCATELLSSSNYGCVLNLLT